MPDFYHRALMENRSGFKVVELASWHRFRAPMRLRGFAVLWVGFCIAIFRLFLVTTSAAEPASQSNAVTRGESPPLSSQLASLRVEPGFRIELAASEPMVTAPVAMAFDENGRLFVVERWDDPNRRDTGPHLGRVRMLEAMDTNGVFQSSTFYADDLEWPSAIACYAGGIFVATTPNILYFKDSKNDGVADVRQVVLTGFGDTNTPTAHTLVNSFAWGLDNRIHGLTAGIGGIVSASNWPSGPVSLSAADFAFDPWLLEVFAETGPSQSGLAFGETGRRFTCDYARPLRIPMYELRYGARNAYYVKPPELIDVASPATPIFRLISTTTEKSNAKSLPAGTPNSAVAWKTNLLASTWLTNAQGCLVYRGSAFPTNYVGNVFVADPSAHAIRRFVLRDNGLEPVDDRATQERQGEFLVSSDPGFRPVQIAAGPDGALYIVDMRNESDRGRIYRVVPAGLRSSQLPQVAKARTYDLVAALAGNDGWHCDTAARLLYERRDPASVGLLTNMLNNSRVPLARLRALHALDGLGSLREAQVLRGLQDFDARVREDAVWLSERLVTNGLISDVLWGQLRMLAGDPSLRVRYQLAFTVGEIARPDKAPVLAQIIRRDPGNRWIRNAVLSSLAEGAGDFFLLLASDPRFRTDVAGNELLRQVALMIGSKGRLDEVRQVISFATQPQLDRLQIFGLLAALGEGLRNTRSSLVMASPQAGLEPFFSVAMQAAIDSFSPPAIRIQAVRLTGVSSYTFADTSDWLLMLCNPGPWPDLRSAAVATVAHYDAPGALTGLLDRWQTFPPFLRNQAVASLLSRRSHVAAVLDAVESGRLPAGDLSSTQRDFLRTYSEPAVSARALRLFGPIAVLRPAVVDLYKPALRLTGIKERGRPTFVARCAGCHQLDGVGQALGPDLVGVKTKGKDKTLLAILEPNAEVPSQYATCVVQTAEGDNLVGVKSDENVSSVTLRQPRGESVVCPRLNLRNLQTQTWSLMPEGLEQGLTTQDMADLLEYLMTASS